MFWLDGSLFRFGGVVLVFFFWDVEMMFGTSCKCMGVLR